MSLDSIIPSHIVALAVNVLAVAPVAPDTMSGRYTAPPNLAEVRERLFSVQETVLHVVDFEAYWSHVDNIWSSTKKPRVYEGRTVRLEEAAEELSERERDSLFARWITCLGKVTGPIRQMGVMELLGSIPELPLKWIEATDSQLRAEGVTESQMEERRREVAGVDDGSELEG